MQPPDPTPYRRQDSEDSDTPSPAKPGGSQDDIGTDDGSDHSDDVSDEDKVEVLRPAPLTGGKLIPPLSWKRPTGDAFQEDREYPNWRTWARSRWAWEFLRRRPDFVEACHRAREDDRCKTEVSATFHLVTFKDFAENYDMGVKARFRTGLTSYPKRAAYSEFLASGAAYEVRQLTVPIRRDEVVLRFSISATTFGRRTVINNQLEQAKRRLLAFADRFHLVNGTGTRAKDRAEAKTPSRYLELLRVLDLLQRKPSLVALAETIKPDESDGLRDAALESKGNDLKKAAEEVRDSYLAIAIVRDKK